MKGSSRELSPSASERTRAAPSHGPVQFLCEEIGFRFDRRLERDDVLRAFVRELVEAVAHQRSMQEFLATHGGTAPSLGSQEVLSLAYAMVRPQDRPSMIAAAEAVHEVSNRLNPDGAIPTDHIIDMLSSCASAIRFGLESPCRSRHAAAAADHVWQRVYGVSLLDSQSHAWGKDWARAKLQDAIVSLLPDDRGGGVPVDTQTAPQPVLNKESLPKEPSHD